MNKQKKQIMSFITNLPPPHHRCRETEGYCVTPIPQIQGCQLLRRWCICSNLLNRTIPTTNIDSSRFSKLCNASNIRHITNIRICYWHPKIDILSHSLSFYTLNKNYNVSVSTTRTEHTFQSSQFCLLVFHLHLFS